MNTLSYKTVSANKNTITKEWYTVDAEGQVLGRLASKIAFVLRGKHKPDFTPHVDCGDCIIVLNADKFTLSGKKMDTKEYITHSGYPGGQKSTSVQKMLNNTPERVLENAVRGMLPKNRLGRQIFRNLYVYVGTEHEHEAQKPQTLDLNKIK